MHFKKNSFLITYKNYIFSLIGVGFLIYFNGLFGTFVWDDIYQIQNNYLVHSIANFLSFFSGSTFTPQNSSQLGGLYYRPLMTLVFSFIYTLFGTQTFPYHFLQLSIHVANAILLFYLFKRFFKTLLAFVLSLLFLIHPISVEAVVYVSALQEPLCFFFGILSLILFMQDNLSHKSYATIGLLLLCSLLSKETGILFGFFILSYFLLFKRKTKWDIIQTICTIIFPIFLYLFLRLEVAKVYFTKVPDVPMMTAPFFQRIFTMPAVFLFYIKTFFFPKDLFIFQEWSILSPTINFYLPLVIDIIFICGVVFIGIWLWKKDKRVIPSYIFFSLWFLLGIGFILQIFPLDMTVSDRLFYFPMVGILGVMGLIFQEIKITNPKAQEAWVYIMIVIFCTLSLRTFIRNSNWYNELSLYSHDVQYQQNDRLENLLAGALYNVGQYALAQKYYVELLSRNPNQPALVFNVAHIYEIEGNFTKSDDLYKSKLSIDDTGVLYLNYARVLMLDEGKIKQAKAISSEGLSKFPQNTTLMVIDAIAFYKLGNKHASLSEIKQAEKISSDPNINKFYLEIQNDNLSL